MTNDDYTFVIQMTTILLAAFTSALASILAFLKVQQVSTGLTQVAAVVDKTVKHVEDIKHATNGMKDQLVTAVALSEFARGRLEERTGETSPSADPNALVDQNGHTLQHGEQ